MQARVECAGIEFEHEMDGFSFGRRCLFDWNLDQCSISPAVSSRARRFPVSLLVSTGRPLLGLFASLVAGLDALSGCLFLGRWKLV